MTTCWCVYQRSPGSCGLDIKPCNQNVLVILRQKMKHFQRVETFSTDPGSLGTGFRAQARWDLFGPWPTLVSILETGLARSQPYHQYWNQYWTLGINRSELWRTSLTWLSNLSLVVKCSKIVTLTRVMSRTCANEIFTDLGENIQKVIRNMKNC